MKGNSFDLRQSEYFGITKLKSSKNYFKPNNDLTKNYWFKLDDIDLKKHTGKTFSPFIFLFKMENKQTLFQYQKKFHQICLIITLNTL